MSSKTRSRPIQEITPRGPRQHLLPNNRRLRHIHGISLRNLCLVPTSRDRGKTIDDDSVPSSLSSPNKLFASRDSTKLPHSQSTTSLNSHGAVKSPSKSKERSLSNGHATKPRKTRRKSTLEWAAASPSQRQEKAEDAIHKHVADVFFSLHVDAVTDPLYVSEIAERSMNPSFGFFDLKRHSTFITANSNCTIKFWASRNAEDGWTSILSSSIDIRTLKYVGSNIDALPEQLSDNRILVHLTDGIYTPADTSTFEADPPSSTSFSASLKDPSPNAEPTSSYDALMRLSTLDACVQDAVATHSQLASEIKTLIDENHDRFSLPLEMSLARGALAEAKRSVDTTRKTMSNLQAQVGSMRQALKSRRDSIDLNRKAQTRARGAMSRSESHIRETRSKHSSTIKEISAQRRRIVTDLQSIYPIEPATPTRKRPPNSTTDSTPGTPTSAALAFTIRHLPLPNSTFTSQHLTTATVSAALGYTAHLFSLLSTALAVPLPYPIHPSASTSTIADPISLLSTPPSQRHFPLYLPHSSRGTVPLSKHLGTAAHARFEYAVFLLNKNIECLAAHTNGDVDSGTGTGGRSRTGLRLLDIRQTLPNLKYIILVVTAGSGDVPGRKRGGGFGGKAGPTRLGLGHLRARLASREEEGNGSVVGSRRGSNESGGMDAEGGEAGRAADEVRRRLSATAPDDAV